MSTSPERTIPDHSEEPENTEGHEDGFLLSILDPSDNRVRVWFVRLFLFWGVFFLAGFYITFGTDPVYWSVGLGGVFAYILCVGSYMLESYVIVPWWYRNEVGLPMVHWMSWAVFLDIIYHVINPRNAEDCRAEFSTAPVLSEDETTRGEFWLDFVADVGDGFNPTFAVFSSMARSTLDFGAKFQLPRANAVVVGGDISYPWPRYVDIMARFIRPLSWAYPEEFADEKRNMYVMPGNHEWADGLRNFRRLILNRKSIGGWTVANNASYFAVKLPHGWWMFCVDPGNELSQDMDAGQVEYFTRVVTEQTTSSDRFILCVHEPDWIKNSLHGYALFNKMAVFRQDVMGSRLRLTLAGDLHYYRRMEEVGGGEVSVDENADFPSYTSARRQLVVAGHGGAFAHPTYVPDGSGTIGLGEPHITNPVLYRTVCNYPTPENSKRAYNKHWFWGFTFGKNHGFGSILGLVYVGMCLAVSPLDYSSSSAFPSALEVLENTSYMTRMVTSFWFYPSLIFVSIVLMVIATTSVSLRTFSNVFVNLSMGFLHIALHVLSVLGWRKLIDATLAALFSSSGMMGVDFWSIVVFCFAANSAMFIVGFLHGPFVTSVLLYVSQNIVGNSYNEGMATIEYQEDKGFLRMKISREQVDLFTIGLTQVPRKWNKVDNASNEFPSKYEGGDVEVKPFVVERVTILRGEDES